MRAPIFSLIFSLVVVAATACGGHGPITNLQLQWTGAGRPPTANPNVAQALAAVPVALSVVDERTDPSAVGRYEDDGFIVRTSMNVAQYTAAQIGEMLRSAGAQFSPQPMAGIEIGLVAYDVVEGGSFQGTARLRVTVKRGTDPVGWTKLFEGRSTRWGRTHNPENFNEALSNALHEATGKLLQDPDFATALGGQGVQTMPPSPAR